MKVPRVRFTVRRLMAAVAVLAALLGAEAALRRARMIGRRYDECASIEILSAANARRCSENAKVCGERGQREWASYWSGYAARLRSRADAYGRLREKYRRALARPWLPVAPDPPEPE